MKKTIFLLLLFPFALSVLGQKKKKPEEAFYVMDENFQGTTVEKAKYLAHAIKQTDSSWQFDTYNMYGPMISSEHYKDEKATTLHGEAVYFNAKGTRDSIGNFYNGLPNGSFYYFNDTGATYLQKEFSRGILVESIDRIKRDSTEQADAKRKKDTIKRTEIESDFPGQQAGWIKYLTNHLVYPERAQKLQKEGSVVIQFIVDTEGHIMNPQIVQSVEFSLDTEALRMINESPAWSPALQDGKKVKSYKKQPITYRLSR